MGLRLVIEELKDVFEALNDSGLPTPKQYFTVFIGMPDILPVSDNHVIVLEAVDDTLEYKTCGSPNKNTDIYINIFCKGTREIATLETYDMVDIVTAALVANESITNTCIGSFIVESIYGEFAAPTTNSNMIAGARLTLRCLMN